MSASEIGTSDIDDRLRLAVDLLDQRLGLGALWLFGSEAQGAARPDSDVDLAGLFHRSPDPLELFEVAGDLQEVLGRPVDLVDLDRTSPILAMQVLRHGRLLTDRDPKRRVAFAVRALSLYEDLKILRREVDRGVAARLRRG